MKRLIGLGIAILGLWSLPVCAEAVNIAPGITYEQMVRPGPVVMHVLRASLGEASLAPTVAAGGARVLDMATLPAIVGRQGSGGSVAGAINGGYSLLQADQGAPIGLLISDGELLCDPWPTRRSCLVFGTSGTPRIESLGLRGTIVGIDGRSQTVSGLNRPRLPGELVMYTPRFNPATRVRDAGRQVVLSHAFTEGMKLSPGAEQVAEVTAIVDGMVNVEIPADGVVLAGSGAVESWLNQRRVGERLTFRFDMVPNLGPVRCALGAGPRIVRDGRVSIEAEQEGLSVRLNMGRQPRSAVGISGDTLFMVATDGRQPGYSIGIDLAELAQVLVDLGCTQAMEFDGGGATTMYVRDRLVNRPSDGQPRALASALLLLTTGRLTDVPLPNPTVSGGGVAPGTPDIPGTNPPVTPVGPGGTAGAGELARLGVEPAELTASVGETVPIKVTGLDAQGVAVPLDLAKLSYEIGPAGAEPLGEITADGAFVAKREGNGRLTVRLGDKFTTITVRVAKSGATPVTPDPGGVKPPTNPGGTTPTPVTPNPPAGDLRPGQGVKREPVKVPEGRRKTLDGFENIKHWRLGVLPKDAPAKLELVDN
ncbi:MAG: phosphodiester glycosidase family protein, partial [Armatimonadetes bacterium]|nr:phosphodiester glycosidase family protein [Armatimonadota bacterium]